MNWTPASFSSSSPQGSASLEDDLNVGTPAYLSPAHASYYYPECPQRLAGLGISLYEAENPFCHSGLYRQIESSSLPVAGCSGSMGLLKPSSEPTLDVGGFVPEMSFESYTNCGVSNCPYGLYSMQAMTRPSTYGEIQSAFLGYPSATGQAVYSGDVSPAGLGEIKELQSFREQPSFAGALDTVEAPLLSQEATLSIDNVFPDLFPNNSGNLLTPSPKGRAAGHSRGTRAQSTPREAHPRSYSTDTPSPRRKRSPESNRKCDFCDFTFTRASNCRDHMRKKHGPECKKTYSCGFCQQAFSRKPDLTRHVDCVHLKLKRFGCECGRYFSRQDILSRHKADGCQRKPRRTKVSKESHAI